MKALILGPDERAAIDRLLDYAKKHPVLNTGLVSDKADYDNPEHPHNQPEFLVTLPVDFKVRFTLEHTPVGAIRHLTIDPGVNIPEAVIMLIAAALQFPHNPYDGFTYFDVNEAGRLRIIQQDEPTGHRHLPTECPNCKAKINGAMFPGAPWQAPADGDMTICIVCEVPALYHCVDGKVTIEKMPEGYLDQHPELKADLEKCLVALHETKAKHPMPDGPTAFSA